MEQFHPPIIFRGDSQSTIDVFLLWWDYSTVRSIQKYSEKILIHFWKQQIRSRPIVFQRRNLEDPQILVDMIVIVEKTAVDFDAS